METRLNDAITNGAEPETTAETPKTQTRLIERTVAHMATYGRPARREVLLSAVGKGLTMLGAMQHAIAECADFAEMEAKYFEMGYTTHRALQAVTNRMLALRERTEKVQYAAYRLAKLCEREGIQSAEVVRMWKLADTSMATIALHLRTWSAHKDQRLRELEVEALSFVTLAYALSEHMGFEWRPTAETAETVTIADTSDTAPVTEVTL